MQGGIAEIIRLIWIATIERDKKGYNLKNIISIEILSSRFHTALFVMSLARISSKNSKGFQCSAFMENVLTNPPLNIKVYKCLVACIPRLNTLHHRLGSAVGSA